MNSEIRKLKPVPVVYGPVVAPRGEVATLAHRSREGLIEAARRRLRDGEIVDVDSSTFHMEADGVWTVDVRLPAVSDSTFRPQRRWVAPLLWIGVPLTTLAGAGWWLAMVLGAVPLAVLMVAAVAVLVGMLRQGGKVVDVLVKQEVRIHN